MENASCPLCSNNDHHNLMSVIDWYNSNGGPFTFVRCCQCGLTYLNPRPSSSELITYNHTMWEMWSISEQSKEKIGSTKTAVQTYREIIRKVNKYKPQKGSLLEVGTGQGGLLKVFQNQGWDVYGLDISDECITYIHNEHGIENAFAADLLDARFSDNKFDVIIFNHLIEHLSDPKLYIKEIYRIIKPEGILCISTPNIDSLSAKIFGRYWQALFVPLHLVLFSPDTLTRLLRETNLSVVEISHFSNTTNTYIFLRSLACIVQQMLSKFNNKAKMDQTNGRPYESIRASDIKGIYSYLRPIITILILPIIIVEGIIKRGASITVYAKPEKSPEKEKDK